MQFTALMNLVTLTMVVSAHPVALDGSSDNLVAKRCGVGLKRDTAAGPGPVGNCPTDIIPEGGTRGEDVILEAETRRAEDYILEPVGRRCSSSLDVSDCGDLD
ncbi:hypothetical protein FB45DRAFT_1032825 [Roridomyces roridus]|uniref:Uncharacterized protein n=1 Tax=Roridomyces roridus TaxID=1738132 RepID=A0AAD7FF12_9AGAR|nr:hypothetical protein FB45DRAFT_1032825 [Roridomyces roridus]